MAEKRGPRTGPDQTSVGLVAKRLRQARIDAGLTQEELGRRLGISAVSISDRERGVTEISAEELKRIARILAKPTEWFYGTDSVSPEDEIDLMFHDLKDDLTDEERQSLREALQFIQWKRMQRRRGRG